MKPIDWMERAMDLLDTIPAEVRYPDLDRAQEIVAAVLESAHTTGKEEGRTEAVAGVVADLRERADAIQRDPSIMGETMAAWVAGALRKAAEDYANGPSADALARRDARVREEGRVAGLEEAARLVDVIEIRNVSMIGANYTATALEMAARTIRAALPTTQPARGGECETEPK